MHRLLLLSRRFVMLFVLGSWLAACAGPVKKAEPQAEEVQKPRPAKEEGFVEDQPFEPVSSDDAFFLKPAQGGEVFRVLITRDNYSVRQLASRDAIQRPADARGDREQLNAYREITEQIDFKDWEIEGTLDVRLNPHTGQIEQLQYAAGRNPKTWQAAKLFQEDLTRFRFKYPTGVISPTRFQVNFRWVINRRPGLSEQDGRKRAIEWLRDQKQKQ